MTNLYFKFQVSSSQWTGENWYRVCSVMEKRSRPESRTISTRATFLQNHETWSRVLFYLSISKHVTNLYFKFQVSSSQWTGENWYRVCSVMENGLRPESRTISTRATFLQNHKTWSGVLLYLSISKHVTNLYSKFQVSSSQWTGENWYRVCSVMEKRLGQKVEQFQLRLFCKTEFDQEFNSIRTNLYFCKAIENWYRVLFSTRNLSNFF